MNSETRKFYDKHGRKYALFQERNYLDFKSLFDEASWIQFSAYLPDDRNAKILDAGCGGGGWSLKIAGLGYTKLSLIDFSESCIQGAVEVFERHGLRESAEFYHGDLAEMKDFPDNHFDFVFCERDPLEYCFQNQDEAFGELVRVACPGGIITLSSGTSYRVKQQMLAGKRFQELFEFERTGIFHSEEGWVRPVSRAKILEWFDRHGIDKLQISGRLTISDLMENDQWEGIYEDPELKKRILELELKYQGDEHLADYSSHIFAAGRKRV